MTTNDILSHPQMSAPEFYQKLQGTTLAEAAKEPLKIGDLVEMQTCMQRLRSGNIVTFGEALCYICVDNLCSMYHRKYPMSDNEKEYISKEMSAKFKHWSVQDLPTFVKMCTGGRLPSMKLGETEYELIVLDVPSILGKMEVYDRMRPGNLSTQGMSPMQTDTKPLSDWHLHHLIDGEPYEWHGYQAALRYWRSKPDMNDPRDVALIERVTLKTEKIAIHSSNPLPTTSHTPQRQ